MLEPMIAKAASFAPNDQAGEPQASFVALEGRLSNNRVQISKILATLGFDPSCDIWLPYPEIKSLHAIMAKTAQGWWIRGTNHSSIAINGKTVSEGALSQGDRLGIGRLILEFVDNNPVESNKSDFTLRQRLHASVLAAKHMESMEQRWAVELKESRLALRARRIANRLKSSANPQIDPTTNLVPLENTLGKDGRLQYREEKLALEQARLNRLRTRLITRWKKLNALQHAQPSSPHQQQPQDLGSQLKDKNSPKLRIHSPESAIATSGPGASDLNREITLLLEQKSDLLMEIHELTLKAVKIRVEMASREPLIRPATAEEIIEAPGPMADHQAERDLDTETTIKAIKKELIALAQREHMIAEREALLETLLGQRQRQREELDLSIDGAGKEIKLANTRAEESEIETNRLRLELEQLNQVLDRRISAQEISKSSAMPEAFGELNARLDRLTESLEKAADWACQDLDTSERAELEFLRFNSLLHGLSASDDAASSVRTMVDSACVEIRNSLIPEIDAILRAANCGFESPDRRLVIEAHRWKIKAETLGKALMETRALLQKNEINGSKVRTNQAA